MQVVFYMNEKGEEPARDLLDSLDVKMRAKMTRTIKLLEVIGNKAVLTHGFIKKTLTRHLRLKLNERFNKEMNI